MTTAQRYDSWDLWNRKFPKHSHYPALKNQVHATYGIKYRSLSNATHNQDQNYSTWRQKSAFNFLPSCLLMRKVEKNPWLQYCQHICCESDPTPSLVTRNQTLGCRQISLLSTSIAAAGNVCGHCFETFLCSHWMFSPSMDSRYCILTFDIYYNCNS